MDSFTRVAIKSCVVVVIVVCIIMVVAVISARKENNSCSRTIENGVRDCFVDWMTTLIRVEDRLRHGEPVAAFALLTQAKQIATTLKTLYPLEFIQQIGESDALVLSNPDLVHHTRRLAQEIGQPVLPLSSASSFSPGDVKSSLSESRRHGSLWEECDTLSRALEVRARTEGQRQLQQHLTSLPFLSSQLQLQLQLQHQEHQQHQSYAPPSRIYQETRPSLIQTPSITHIDSTAGSSSPTLTPTPTSTTWDRDSNHEVRYRR